MGVRACLKIIPAAGGVDGQPLVEWAAGHIHAITNL